MVVSLVFFCEDISLTHTYLIAVMKPRLSEAPNGIVGNKGQHNRELLAVASAAPSSKSSSTATTIAVGKGSPRNRSNTDIVKRPVPRFTVVGSTESSPGTKKRYLFRV